MTSQPFVRCPAPSPRRARTTVRTGRWCTSCARDPRDALDVSVHRHGRCVGTPTCKLSIEKVRDYAPDDLAGEPGIDVRRDMRGSKEIEVVLGRRRTVI